jgi:hypothetical protein
MIDRDQQRVDSISQELAKWESGELCLARDQERLVREIVDYLRLKKESLERLRAIEPRTQRAEGAISKAVAEFNAVATMKNRIVDMVEQAEAKRNRELKDWNGTAAFSDGWYTPVMSSPGIQTVRKSCCECGHKLIFDYRIRDQLVQYRAYMEKRNDEAKEGGNGRAGKECAAAG